MTVSCLQMIGESSIHLYAALALSDTFSLPHSATVAFAISLISCADPPLDTLSIASSMQGDPICFGCGLALLDRAPFCLEAAELLLHEINRLSIGNSNGSTPTKAHLNEYSDTCIWQCCSVE